MPSLLTILLQTALLSLVYRVWVIRHEAYKSLVLAPLPSAYYHGGPPSSCEIVVDPNANRLRYCEDAKHWGDGRLLITCDPGRKEWNTVMGPLIDPNPRGDIWVYDVTSKTTHHVEFEAYPSHADFHPLGITFFPSSSSSEHSIIFVVNHARNETTIEQFALSTSPPYHARYIRTLTHPEFVSPNSVAAISETTFYVTNDHRFTRRLPNPIGHVIPIVESLLAIPLSWVDRVDLSSSDSEIHVTRVASNIAFANGIAISHDEKLAAVASSTGQIIHVFDIDGNKDFVSREAVSVPFLPDNVEFEIDGSITVAGHPHFPSLARLAAKKQDISPSWIVSIRPRVPSDVEETEGGSVPLPVGARSKARLASANSSYTVATLYQSDGSHFSSSTTGIRVNGGKDLVVVGLYQRGILHCTAS